MSQEHFNSAPWQLVGHAEAAKVFGVQPSTMARWGRTGKVPTVVLPSGRRKYSLDWCRWAMSQHGSNGTEPKQLKEARIAYVSIDKEVGPFGGSVEIKGAQDGEG